MSRVRPVLCTALVACVAAALPAAASAAPSMSLSVDPAVPGIGKRFYAVSKGVRESPPNEAGPGSSRVSVFQNVAREPCAPTYELEAAKTRDADGYTMIDFGGVADGPFEYRSDVQNKYPDARWTLRNGLRAGRYRFCGYLTNDDAYPVPPPFVLTRLDFTVRKNCANAREDAVFAAQTLKNEKKALKFTLKRSAKRYHKQGRSRVKKAKRKLKKARRVRKALC